MWLSRCKPFNEVEASLDVMIKINQDTHCAPRIQKRFSTFLIINPRYRFAFTGAQDRDDTEEFDAPGCDQDLCNSLRILQGMKGGYFLPSKFSR